jgi:glycosyltransferase involved in cell wall biosynthesis
MDIRTVLKRFSLLKYLYVNIFAYRYKNIYKAKFSKKALLSYSTAPFRNRKRMHIHPNFIENYTLAELLNKQGYIVDVYNNTFPGKINYKKYDIIVGEGLPVSNYFLQKGKIYKIPTIYYATGSHPFYNNIQSYKSLFSFYKRYKKYLASSSRIVNFKWGIGASLSDYLILLGNEYTKKSFTEYSFNNRIFNLFPPHYGNHVISDFSKKDKKKILWFGSFGLIHKDLHTIIDIFHKQDDFELHVCGYLFEEINFINILKPILTTSKNIILHGFLSIKSVEFKRLMEECCFVILTSCAEGCATSVITVMGNGGLIPLISKQCGLDIINGVLLETNTAEEIENVLNNINTLYTKELIIQYSKENIEYIQNKFSIDVYKTNTESIFKDIFKDFS